MNTDKTNASTYKGRLQFILDCFDMGLCTKLEAELAMIKSAKDEVEDIERRLKILSIQFYPYGINRAVEVKDHAGEVNITWQ